MTDPKDPPDLTLAAPTPPLVQAEGDEQVERIYNAWVAAGSPGTLLEFTRRLEAENDGRIDLDHVRRVLDARRPPNPGSAAAIAAGCLCPEVDNSFGLGSGYGSPGRPAFWISAKCELHLLPVDGK